MADARLGITVTTDARIASATFKELAADIKNVGTESVGVTDGVAKVDAALARLAKAPDTPKALALAVAKATVEIEDLRAALDKTPASAEKMKAINTALTQADSAIKSATDRAGRLKDAMGDVAQTAANSGDKFDAARRAAGGLDGAFESMRNTGTGLTKTLGEIGSTVSVFATALGGAVATGQQVGQWIDALSEKYGTYQEKLASVALKSELYNIAMRKVADGTIEAGASIEKTIDNYTRFTVAMGKLDEQSRAFITNMAGLKLPTGFKELGDTGEAMELALKGAFARSEADGRAFVLANMATFKGYIEFMKATGGSVSASLVDMVREGEKMAKANAAITAATPEMISRVREAAGAFNDTAKATAVAEAQVMKLSAAQRISLIDIANIIAREFDRKNASKESIAAYEALILTISKLINAGKGIPEQIDKEIAARKILKQYLDEGVAGYDAAAKKQKEWIADTTHAQDQMRNWTDATQGPHSAFGALSGDFTAINKEVAGFIAAGGDVSKIGVAMTPIILGVAQATERQNAAFADSVRLMGLMRDGMKETMEATQGWTDYLILLKESYQSGTTSLHTYIIQLTEFATQLRTLFGSATGEAQKSLQNMLDIIQQLIATAGGSGPQTYQTGTAGWLDKAINKPKKP